MKDLNNYEKISLNGSYTKFPQQMPVKTIPFPKFICGQYK